MRTSVTAVVLVLLVGLPSACAEEPAGTESPWISLRPDIPFLSEQTDTVAPPPAPPAEQHTVWGVAGVHVYYSGDKMAPNGRTFEPLFTGDLNFNIWLWSAHRVYLDAELCFWTERPGGGNTHSDLDFSKRQFDTTISLAWNYYGPLEVRGLAYAQSNLNRGISLTDPFGYTDGGGIENRYYLRDVYRDLGTDAYDILRSDFVSVGYLPTKALIGANGKWFNPGFFARTYLTLDLIDRTYAYLDAGLWCQNGFQARLLTADLGLAVRPFERIPTAEFRVGADLTGDVEVSNLRTLGYVAFKFVF
jgi:hypothetical protein